MSIVRPINIIYNTNNKDNNNLLQCIFELTLTLVDDTTLVFKDILYSKYCNIFNYSDMIQFKLIKKYILKITVINITKEIYTTKQDFDVEKDTYIYKNEDMYIEFTRNNDGYTNCCCYLIILDNSRLFVTPPNY